MDTKFQTSFIPKKPIAGGVLQRTSPPVNFLSVIARVVFTLTALGAVGVFIWSGYLSRTISKMTSDLQNAEATLRANPISDWERLDNRVNNVKLIMGTHLALSAFFDMLSTLTVQSIRFKSFSYAYTDGKVALSMDGSANSFASVALQSDEFAKKSDILSNQLFSNLNPTVDGDVAFKFTAFLKQDTVLYKTIISPNTTAPAAPALTLPEAPDATATTSSATATTTP